MIQVTQQSANTGEVIPLEGCGVSGDGGVCCDLSQATGDQKCGCASKPALTNVTKVNTPTPIVGWRSQLPSGVLLGVACLTSPCCTPLYVPLVMALLGGTPLAVWMGANLGWVYGGLTLVSVVSVVMAWRRWQQHNG